MYKSGVGPKGSLDDHGDETDKEKHKEKVAARIGNYSFVVYLFHLQILRVSFGLRHGFPAPEYPWIESPWEGWANVLLCFSVSAVIGEGLVRLAGRRKPANDGNLRLVTIFSLRSFARGNPPPQLHSQTSHRRRPSPPPLLRNLRTLHFWIGTKWCFSRVTESVTVKCQ